MSYFNNNNLSGMTYGGYPFTGDNNFNGYSFGHDQYPDFATQSGLFDSDAAAIAGPSGSYDWYLDPSSEGYQGWTLLDVSGHQLVDPYTLHTGTYSNLNTGMNVYGLDIHRQTDNTPAGNAGPSVANPATISFQPPPASPAPAASIGPITPLPAPRILNTSFPLPTASYTERALPPDVYEQPLAGPSSTGQWSYHFLTTSVDKGKARATDHFSPSRPASTGDDAWWYQQPHIADNYGAPTPQTVPGVPLNTDSPASIAPSYGPQRSGKGAKGKGRATQTGKGKRKREPTEPLPEGVDSSWEQTKDRFVWELLEEYYFRPAGRSINPEMAFADISKFVKEDLHRSPLAAQAAEAEAKKKESRVYEQYLIHILRELLRSRGETQTEMHLYTRALEELERELAPVNQRRVLREGHSGKKDPSELNTSSGKVKHRQTEQDRRTAIKHLQDQLSVFFWVEGQKKITIGDLLLSVVIYLRIGPSAFPGIVHPLSHIREQ